MAKAQDEELLATLVKMREGLKSHHIPMTAADITDLVEAVDDLDSMLSEMKLMFMQMTYKIEKVQNILVKNGVYEKYKEDNCGGYQD